MVEKSIIEGFIRAVKQDHEEKTYTYAAEVARVDDEGKAWVYVAGGDVEAPTESSASEVKRGDQVTVEWRNNKLYIVGNATNPAAGTFRVQAVEQAANTAREAANNAVTEAGRAKVAADDAKAAADSVHTIAEQAQEDAGAAKTAATNAMKGLAQVEDVVGTLDWITSHSRATSDTAPQEGKSYYIKNQDDTFTLVTDVEGKNPSQEGWYEMDEAIQNYIMSHLVLLNDGLYVMSDNSGWRVKITNTGIYILDENGDPVTMFSESIIFSSDRSQYIGSENAYIEFDSVKNRILISGRDVYMIAPMSAFAWDVELDVTERVAMNDGLGLSEDTSSWVYDDITTSEMEEYNAELGTSDPTDEWIYDDVTVNEYKGLCNKLGIGYQFGKSVYIGLDAISLGDGFFVDDDGYLISTSGKIGGWDIGENRLSHALPTSPDYISLSGEEGVVFGVKDSNNYMMLSGTNGIDLGSHENKISVTGKTGIQIGKSGTTDFMSMTKSGIQIGKSGTTDFMSMTKSGGLKIGEYFSVSPTGVITARRGVFAGFTMVPITNGRDYMVSDYSVGSVDYRTWIRSATESDAGDTWVFSAQVKKASESNYSGVCIIKASGEFESYPVKADGSSGGTQFRVLRTGIFLYPGTTVSNQPNLYWNPSTNRLCYTTWSSSSEQIKKKVKKIKSKEILPENLYEIDIVQFQYKDECLDREDARYDQDLIGFLIEDLDKHYPVAVDKADPEDPKTWAWNSAYLIPAMMKLIQDQKKEIDDLKSDIDEIKSMLKGDQDETVDSTRRSGE